MDKLDALEVEISIDHTGKVWVNVDGVCAVRIGHVHRLVVETSKDIRTLEDGRSWIRHKK